LVAPPIFCLLGSKGRSRESAIPESRFAIFICQKVIRGEVVFSRRSAARLRARVVD
jgi:hypothetical protein